MLSTDAFYFIFKQLLPAVCVILVMGYLANAKTDKKEES